MVDVSIIIPVYNVAPYIEGCLRSVMRQTYKDPMECLLVDDCGTDESIPIAERMIAKNDGPIRFEILHHEHNRGLSAARNTGMEKAVGEYIFFIDSDDEITEDCLEKMMVVVREHPEVELVQGEVLSVPHRSYYDMSFLKDIDILETNDLIRKSCYCFPNRLPVNAWNKLIKKSFIINNRLFFREGLLFEDELWMFKAVKYLAAYFIVHHPTYIHRCCRPESIMTTKTSEEFVDYWSVILDEIICGLDSPFYREQLLYYSMILVSIYGHEGLYPPSGLMKKYRGALLKEQLFDIGIIMFYMEKMMPFIRGRVAKKVIIRFPS